MSTFIENLILKNRLKQSTGFIRKLAFNVKTCHKLGDLRQHMDRTFFQAFFQLVSFSVEALITVLLREQSIRVSEEQNIFQDLMKVRKNPKKNRKNNITYHI